MCAPSIKENVLWSPLIDALKKTVNEVNPLTDIVVPFVQIDALKYVLEKIPYSPRFRILTRWNRNDLISGVSDPEVYPLLYSKNIPLFVHSKLHSKIYLSSNNFGIVGSGNLTITGLGLNNSISQIETAAISHFTKFDRLRVEHIFDSGELVTQSHYDRAKEIAKASDQTEIRISDEPIYSKYSLTELPMSAYPDQIWSIYQAGYPDSNVEELVAHSWSDLIRYEIPMNISNQREFNALLKKKFLKQPLVSRVLKYIEEYTPVGMPAFNPKYEGVQNGAIRKFLKGIFNSEDSTLPQRVNNLETWLPFCKPEIKLLITQPGRGSSRVFFWQIN